MSCKAAAVGAWDLLVPANVCCGILFLGSFSWAPGMIPELGQNVRGDLSRAATGKGTQERQKGRGLRGLCTLAEKRDLRPGEAS